MILRIKEWEQNEQASRDVIVAIQCGSVDIVICDLSSAATNEKTKNGAQA